MSDEHKDQLRSTQYDGIQEYDNDLPRWWVGTFVLTIVFAVAYWMVFYNFQAPDSSEKYDQAYQAHAAKYFDQKIELTDQDLIAMASSSSDLEAGHAIFKQNCVACHMENGGGSIGPNLTDAYWIHGNAPTSVYKVIENGIVEKGMLAWKGILTPKQMKQVSAYVVSIMNTNVEGGKEPQGEKVEPLM